MATQLFASFYQSALLMQCIGEIVTGKTMSGTSPREHGMALVADLEAFVISPLCRSGQFPLDTLEGRFGISRRHITRLFREGTGMSIGEFQQRTRYEYSLPVVAETDLPIGEAAFRAGSRKRRGARACATHWRPFTSALRTTMARSVKK